MADYIDKEKMFEEFAKHRKRTAEARAAGKDDPQLPNYIGSCFLLLANKIASRPNFSSYSYIDEMISDGIENCIMAANNFDPERSEKNPFGYFSKIIWWAFLRRIDKEKRQTYVKYKSWQNMNIMGELYGGEDFGITASVDNEFMDAVVEDFEEKKRKKSKKAVTSKKKGKSIDDLFTEEDTDEEAIID